MKPLFKALLWIALTFGAIIGVLRVTVINFWTIPADDPLLSASLAPTLDGGDVVVVWTQGHPGFGDVTRCRDPESPERWVIGRVFGEAGDKVTIDGASVSVNNKRTFSPHGCDKILVNDPTSGAPVELFCDIVELGGTTFQRARAQGDKTRSRAGGRSAHDVAQGQLFLVSDNMYFHSDSRDYGALDIPSCPDHIVFRLWSAKGWSDSTRRLSVIR